MRISRGWLALTVGLDFAQYMIEACVVRISGGSRTGDGFWMGMGFWERWTMADNATSGQAADFDQMYEENDFEPKGISISEDAILLNVMLDTLIEELGEMIPDAARIIDMLKEGELEKDVAKELGIAKTTLNYRKKKITAFLQERLADFR